MKEKLDKNFIVTSNLKDESDEKEYWLLQAPQKRLEALEFMRQAVYCYDPTSSRLQRILTIIERK